MGLGQWLSRARYLGSKAVGVVHSLGSKVSTIAKYVAPLATLVNPALGLGVAAVGRAAGIASGLAGRIAPVLGMPMSMGQPAPPPPPRLMAKAFGGAPPSGPMTPIYTPAPPQSYSEHGGSAFR